MTDTKLGEATLATLALWRLNAGKIGIPLQLYLGADVGGTNCRLAVINKNERVESAENPYLLLGKFKSNTTQQLVDILRHVGEQFVKETGTTPVTACFAIAGPISGQGKFVSVTNYTGQKDLWVTDLPAIFCPHESTRFINDLASTCHGINFLSEENLLNKYFDSYWSSANQADPHLSNVNYAVLSMGTGLGCGLLVQLPNGQHEVVATENGHSTVSTLGPDHPGYAEELSFLNFLSKKLYHGKHFIEWEDICSGRGLLACYQYVILNHPAADSTLDAATISKKAVGPAHDPYCRQAMTLHYKYLFRSAQQQCVGLNCKGFFLTGDNQIANNALVNELREEFHAEFLNHPKLDWIQHNVCFRQTKSTDLNLHGALFAARLIARQSVSSKI
jgi:glucokinase